MQFGIIFFIISSIFLISKNKTIIKRLETRDVSAYEVKPGNERENLLKKIIWIGHAKAIGDATNSYKLNNKKYVISIRETGKLSIKRIEEGAKAKPHTILEKSIKESSMKKIYGDLWKSKTKSFYNQLSGFAGHYGPHGLLGVRADGWTDAATADKVKCCTDCKDGCTYVEISDAIELLKKNSTLYTQQFYTGDYDIHEIYDNSLKTIPEATPEKLLL
jgi:hypothetical protein